LDHALEHVNGSRYALVHAVAKRARQITLWLTADPAELRAEAAPPPMAGETVSRDPVALSEAEILDGEVIVHWDPDGRVDEQEIPDATLLETDPLLLEGLEGEDEDESDLEDEAEALTPALSQAMEAAPDEELAVEDTDEVADDEIDEAADEDLAGDDEIDAIEEIPLDEVDEGEDEEEPEA
jgi:hypothetical protein